MTAGWIEASVPSLQALESFLAAWPYLPHRRVSQGDLAACAALEARRLRQITQAPEVHTWTAGGAAGTIGLALLRPLPWDSAVLGFPAARLFLLASGSCEDARATAAALIAKATGAAVSQGIRHISTRVDASDEPAIHSLEESGFRDVDTLLTFSAPADRLSPQDRYDGTFRPAVPSDADALAELAGDAFRDGRFYADPTIPAARAREIYRQWAANCCLGTAADHTIVATAADSSIAGFVACRIDRETAVLRGGPAGTIPLIAVHASARGRGVGSALIARARTWFIDNGASMVEVGTQARNLAARRLYQQCGFELSDSSRTFHLTIDA